MKINKKNSVAISAMILKESTWIALIITNTSSTCALSEFGFLTHFSRLKTSQRLFLLHLYCLKPKITNWWSYYNTTEPQILSIQFEPLPHVPQIPMQWGLKSFLWHDNFFFNFMAAPMAYGGSWARDWIWTTPVILCHSCRSTGSFYPTVSVWGRTHTFYDIYNICCCYYLCSTQDL